MRLHNTVRRDAPLNFTSPQDTSEAHRSRIDAPWYLGHLWLSARSHGQVRQVGAGPIKSAQQPPGYELAMSISLSHSPALTNPHPRTVHHPYQTLGPGILTSRPVGDIKVETPGRASGICKRYGILNMLNVMRTRDDRVMMHSIEAPQVDLRMSATVQSNRRSTKSTKNTKRTKSLVRPLSRLKAGARRIIDYIRGRSLLIFVGLTALRLTSRLLLPAFCELCLYGLCSAPLPVPPLLSSSPALLRPRVRAALPPPLRESLRLSVSVAMAKIRFLSPNATHAN
ncbi:uncharacterized protein N7459_009676 [Penicillium hispanicum]|uniref:uncharacterized protein n=1 Tax=Penicillium hispanicum TaxID=1080232 RepID=UPI0025413918|nr:uncharacterized protein N7459_009676 [Penicillium hispanicum]KAJ5570246.1 hypothetical protein N7459_009676 [Penicillium hispanicum]